MKTVAVLSVVALLLLAPSAASQVPDDKLIVPGQRVGAWTLQMTIQEIVGKLGHQEHIASGGQLGADFQGDLRAYRWSGEGLHAYTRDDRTILLLEAYQAPQFVTDKGVKFGMQRGDVEGSYGRPTRVTQWGSNTAQVTLWYNDVGLEVFFTRTSTVGGIGVFRPGAASSIWKP